MNKGYQSRIYNIKTVSSKFLKLGFYLFKGYILILSSNIIVIFHIAASSLYIFISSLLKNNAIDLSISTITAVMYYFIFKSENFFVNQSNISTAFFMGLDPMGTMIKELV